MFEREGVKGTKRKALLSLLTRKRKYRSPSPSPELRESVSLNFLFVGSAGSGQTSLLLYACPERLRGKLLMDYSRTRYGFFPDVNSPFPPWHLQTDHLVHCLLPSHLRNLRQRPHVRLPTCPRRDVGHLGRPRPQHHRAPVIHGVGCNLPMLRCQ